MACGCQEFCNCCVADTDTLSWTGTGAAGNCLLGTVVGDPVGGLVNTVDGVSILIDPASTAPVSLSAAGLLVDCCPAAVLDSETIDFSLPGGAISGDVIIDPDPANLISTTTTNGLLADLVTADSTTVDFSGEGTTLSPLTATVVTGGAGIAEFTPGMMIDYGGAAAPAGWLLADGASILVAAEPDLFAVIGYTYGGAGASFNVPDARGRATYGLGTHPDVDALADSDGLAVASRTPVHAHSVPSLSVPAQAVTASGSNTNVPNTASVSGTSPPAGAGIEQNFNEGTQANDPDLANSDHTHNIAVGEIVVSVTGSTAGGSTGTGTTGTTPVPFVVVNKIIKT